MKSGFAFLLFFTCIFTGVAARADFIFDTSVYYLSDTMKYTTDSKNALTFYSASLNLAIGKSKYFFVGWTVLGLTQQTDPGTSKESKYTTLDMGPRLMLANKSESFQVGVSYLLSNTTTYDAGTGGQEEKLRGTSIYAEMGFMPEWSDHWRGGLKINYYSATFIESLVGETSLTKVSYSKTLIFPTLAIVASW